MAVRVLILQKVCEESFSATLRVYAYTTHNNQVQYSFFFFVYFSY